MKVLILANGDPPSEALLRRLVAEHDLFLATDGAAHHAAALGVMPDIISGDFDSLRLDVAQEQFPQAEFLSTPDQNEADLEKALHVARNKGATAITITGAAGRRIDHTLGSFSMLLRYGAQIPLAIVNDGSEVRAISGEWTIQTTPGDIISTLSFDGLARLTISGVEWPVSDLQLPVGTRGLSNMATEEQVVVQARGGALLVCHLARALGAHL